MGMDKADPIVRLVEVCRRHILPPPDEAVVVPEPYIPYVPPSWNGTLVLAEAQNLSDRWRAYRETLLRWSPEERMTRLGRRDGLLDIHPWDEEWLPMAIFVGFRLKPEETAVSNAILWSQTAKGTAENARPSRAIRRKAAEVWAELLEILRPNHVVTSGKYAHEVLRSAGWPGLHTALVFPGSRNLNRWKAAYREGDLLKAYPEVEEAVLGNPEWFKRATTYKILFACHAMSEAERGMTPGQVAIQLDRLVARKK